VKRNLRTFNDSSIAGVNIVPVIDLCLVLLVILLIISPLMEHPPVEVKLPKAHTIEEKENSIAVTVDPQGRMAVNTQLIARQDLPRILKVLIQEQGDDVVVVIRSDKNVQYGELTELLKTIKSAGAKRISLGTDQSKE
jgi:biopolymer transport protein ExbD